MACAGNLLHTIKVGKSTVLLTGPTGVGKSYIACALGNFAAHQGHTVLYLRAPRLFEMLLQAKSRRLPSQNDQGRHACG
ncbi:MAG: ATP-binding protein [Candidatus Binatia bacterium]|jgi:DNA replication protein DnaC